MTSTDAGAPDTEMTTPAADGHRSSLDSTASANSVSSDQVGLYVHAAPLANQDRSRSPYVEPGSEEDRESFRQMVAALWAKYDAGVPFFTKEAIADILRQLDECHANPGPDNRVSIRGLDGKDVEFLIKTGEVSRSNPAHAFEWTYSTPMLDYNTLEDLTDERYFMWGWHRNQTAYLPLTVTHVEARRDKWTKEPAPLRPAVPAEAIAAVLDEKRRRWDASEESRKLRDTLAAIPAVRDGRIAKVVAFALSSIGLDIARSVAAAAVVAGASAAASVGGRARSASPVPPATSSRSSSTGALRDSSVAVQHAALLTVRDVLAAAVSAASGTPQSSSIQCFAQDPLYDDVDKQVLAGEGITVLDDPRAFLEVDDDCVVISIAPNVAVKSVVVDIARPAVLIWDRVDFVERTMPSTDPNSPRVRRMVTEEYYELDFPRQADHFSDLAIYVRKDRRPQR